MPPATVTRKNSNNIWGNHGDLWLRSLWLRKFKNRGNFLISSKKWLPLYQEKKIVMPQKIRHWIQLIQVCIQLIRRCIQLIRTCTTTNTPLYTTNFGKKRSRSQLWPCDRTTRNMTTEEIKKIVDDVADRRTEVDEVDGLVKTHLDGADNLHVGIKHL